MSSRRPSTASASSRSRALADRLKHVEAQEAGRARRKRLEEEKDPLKLNSSPRSNQRPASARSGGSWKRPNGSVHGSRHGSARCEFPTRPPPLLEGPDAISIPSDDSSVDSEDEDANDTAVLATQQRPGCGITESEVEYQQKEAALREAAKHELEERLRRQQGSSKGGENRATGVAAILGAGEKHGKERLCTANQSYGLPEGSAMPIIPRLPKGSSRARFNASQALGVPPGVPFDGRTISKEEFRGDMPPSSDLHQPKKREKARAGVPGATSHGPLFCRTTTEDAAGPILDAFRQGTVTIPAKEGAERKRRGHEGSGIRVVGGEGCWFVGDGESRRCFGNFPRPHTADGTGSRKPRVVQGGHKLFPAGVPLVGDTVYRTTCGAGLRDKHDHADRHKDDAAKDRAHMRVGARALPLYEGPISRRKEKAEARRRHWDRHRAHHGATGHV